MSKKIILDNEIKENLAEVKWGKTPQPESEEVTKEISIEKFNGNTQETKKLDEKQTNLETKKQVSNTINLNIELERSQTTEKVRYATYLRPDTIKRIKVEALVNDKNEYSLVQSILDNYFSPAQNENE